MTQKHPVQPERMGDCWTVVLPWPDKRLHPNARCHWSRKATATSVAREQGFLTGIVAGLKRAKLPPDTKLEFTPVFFPPDRRKRDDDGLVSSLKAYRDGIADAAGIDDSNFRLQAARFEEPVKHGQVRIELRRVNA